MKIDTCISERVPKMREYYLNNSPLSVNRNLVPWLCHRTQMIYTEGWINSVDAPTTHLRRAMSEAWLLSHTSPVIVEGELIVGQPDYFPFSDEEEKRYKETEYIYDKIIPLREGRSDHLALDYKPLLELGVEGLIEKLQGELDGIDYHTKSSASDYEYLYGCIIELKGLLKLAENYVDYAEKLALEAMGKQKEEYLKIAEILKQVPAKPARSFREALQSMHFFTFSLYGMYSAGRPDQLLIEYYRNDIKNGIMTEAEAQEMIDCYCLQYIPNMSQWSAAGFMVGGRDENGKAVENELTWHFLASIAHTHTPDPNIGFCVTDETSEELLCYVSELLLRGESNPQIWNNDVVTNSMLKNGFDSKASNLFTHSTCVEITPIGCSGISVTSPYINMLKIFLETFISCNDNVTFDELFNRYKLHFEETYNKIILEENLWQLERGRNGTDPMRISVLINDCTKHRLTNDAGGAKYNQIMPTLIGLINTAESLNVIRTLVFEKKLLSVTEFQRALKDNYEGHEELLMYIKKKVKHFGVGDDSVDALAKQTADMTIDILNRYTTSRGSKVIPGSFSYRDHVYLGSKTSASPDGRRNGDPLVAGSGPVQGYDDKGPTLSLISTSTWEPNRFLGGIAINVKMSRNTSLEGLEGIIKGFLKTNCPQLQFTIVNQQELIDAKEHPENHGDLLVRIGGYSDFFVKCPSGLQDELISRFGG